MKFQLLSLLMLSGVILASGQPVQQQKEGCWVSRFGSRVVSQRKPGDCVRQWSQRYHESLSDDEADSDEVKADKLVARVMFCELALIECEKKKADAVSECQTGYTMFKGEGLGGSAKKYVAVRGFRFVLWRKAQSLTEEEKAAWREKIEERRAADKDASK